MVEEDEAVVAQRTKALAEAERIRTEQAEKLNAIKVSTTAFVHLNTNLVHQFSAKNLRIHCIEFTILTGACGELAKMLWFTVPPPLLPPPQIAEAEAEAALETLPPEERRQRRLAYLMAQSEVRGWLSRFCLRGPSRGGRLYLKN